MKDFTNNMELLQGEVLSPILFSYYIHDIYIIKENCPSVDIQLINIFLYMYTDNMQARIQIFFKVGVEEENFERKMFVDTRTNRYQRMYT